MVDGMNATFVVWKFDGVLCQNAKHILERNLYSCFFVDISKVPETSHESPLVIFRTPKKSRHNSINSFRKLLPRKQGPLRDIL